MTKRFEEFGYRLPNDGPEKYAERATFILDDLLENDLATAMYAMQPSAVLALAGLRAISPYHRFDEHIKPSNIKKFDQTLEKHDIYRFGGDDMGDGFVLVSGAGLRDVKNRYSYADKVWKSPKVSTFKQWISDNGDVVKSDVGSGELPKEWRWDLEWTATHSQSGMLLGYPGAAISSAMWAGAAGDTTGSQLLKQVEIMNDTKYDGTLVSYDVYPELVDSEEVRLHAKLWKDTLKLVDDAR